MKFKPQIYFIAFTFLICSCKKDTKIQTVAPKNNSTTSTSYVSLAVGNYWVYQRYSLDTAGTETMTNITDSLYISADTSIAGNMYYYFRQSDTTSTYVFPLANELVRDSAGFLLYYKNMKFMDPIHLYDTVRKDTLSYGVVDFYVSETFSNDVVPAGNYSGVATCIYERFLNPVPLSILYPVTYTRYAVGLGIIHHKVGFTTQPKSGYAWKLVRYHI